MATKRKSLWLQSRRDKVLAQHPLGAFPYLLRMQFGKPTLQERINWFMAGLPVWLENLIAVLIAYAIMFGLMWAVMALPYNALKNSGHTLYAQIWMYSIIGIVWAKYVGHDIVWKEIKKRKERKSHAVKG